MDDAKIEESVGWTAMGAIATCGEECTTVRRCYVHESRYEEVKENLLKVYSSIKIGNPLEGGNALGPLHNQIQLKKYVDALKLI